MFTCERTKQEATITPLHTKGKKEEASSYVVIKLIYPIIHSYQIRLTGLPSQIKTQRDFKQRAGNEGTVPTANLLLFLVNWTGYCFYKQQLRPAITFT